HRVHQLGGEGGRGVLVERGGLAERAHPKGATADALLILTGGEGAGSAAEHPGRRQAGTERRRSLHHIAPRDLAVGNGHPVSLLVRTMLRVPACGGIGWER